MLPGRTMRVRTMRVRTLRVRTLRSLRLRTLRSRLILSHVSLLLILIPLVGVVLIYALESRVVLVNLAKQLTGQAVLVGELLKHDPAALRDKAGAAAFVARTVPLFPGELSVLDGAGAGDGPACSQTS